MNNPVRSEVVNIRLTIDELANLRVAAAPAKVPDG